MKRNLLLYLSKYNHPENIAIASTLAWLSRSQNYLFDTYFDSYHKGIHFPGGDTRLLEEGELTGGTVCGDRHFEELYFLLLNFDVSVVLYGESILLSFLKNLDIPIIANSDRISSLYRDTFAHFHVPVPPEVVMIGSQFGKDLWGLEAYLYPEIFYRQALGMPDSISEDELEDLCQTGSRIACVYVTENVISQLSREGYNPEIVDEVRKGDDYSNITKRVAIRWKESTKGWLLGDPTLVSHWLPTACEEGLSAIYSIPQAKVIAELGELISSKGRVIYGRQCHDQDFFELSRLNQCIQVIDPCRPPFQSVRHVDYTWQPNSDSDGFYNPEYSDEELKQFAADGRILISLMFWSGMIREIANFYNLMDLFAITRLRCGLVLTAQSYEYMMHSPLELLTIPLEQGGVYPLVEPLLGSCGIGVGIEAYFTKERLEEDLRDTIAEISRKVQYENYVPRGWWTTMDTDLERLRWWERPKPIRLMRHSPYFQIRFNKKENGHEAIGDAEADDSSRLARGTHTEKLKKWVRKAGLAKYFEPYRPYEFFGSGAIKEDIISTVKSVGLRYMFSKSGFKISPEIHYMDEDFIALNYTAGRWDGWTPFVTINDVSDLRKSERLLQRRKAPGWIVSTIDSCLYAFSGEFWKRGNELYEIARFCAEGGHSKELINVKPYTVARYARIIAEGNR